MTNTVVIQDDGDIQVVTVGIQGPPGPQGPQGPPLSVQTLTDGPVINWDAGGGAMALLTLGGNWVLAAATHLQAGPYALVVTQDATGGRALAFDNGYTFPGGGSPTLSASPAATDVLYFLSDGVNIWLVGFAANVSSNNYLTEAGDLYVTEAGQNYITEH